MSRFGLLIGALFLCAGCSNSYRGAAIEGWVVDAETKQPLEDVIVVIMWELEHGGFHPDTAGALFRKETVTDQKGHFAFPAWGPMKAEDGFLSNATPYIVLFKRGYLPIQLRNERRPSDNPMPNEWVSDWDGKTVELSKFAGGLREYGHELYSVRFLYGAGYRKCEWKTMPRLSAEVLKLSDECTRQNVSCGLPVSFSSLGCGAT